MTRFKCKQYKEKVSTKPDFWLWLMFLQTPSWSPFKLSKNILQDQNQDEQSSHNKTFIILLTLLCFSFFIFLMSNFNTTALYIFLLQIHSQGLWLVMKSFLKITKVDPLPQNSYYVYDVRYVCVSVYQWVFIILYYAPK